MTDPSHLLIAVAGDSGLNRNPHFGRAEYFDIFDARVDPPLLLERRFTTPFCGPTSGGVWQPNQAVSLIADCVAVLAGRIGPCTRQALAAVEVLPIEHVGPRLGGAELILAGLRSGAHTRPRPTVSRPDAEPRSKEHHR